MRIYYLKWSGTGRAPKDGAAYTDERQAEIYADFCNSRRGWKGRILGYRWVIGTLDLKEGSKYV